MPSDISRVFNYTWEFYSKNIGVLAIFSIPFIIAFIIALVVPTPTYLALGNLHVRTGSIPDLSFLDIILTIFAYAISVFLVADVWTNINLLIRSKRTKVPTSTEIIGGMQEHALSIFFVFTIMVLFQFALHIVTYDSSLQFWLYPLLSFILSFFLFFVPPAVVIDHADSFTAIQLSINMAIRKWYLVLIWAFLGLGLMTIFKVVLDIVLKPYSEILLLLINSLLILPFLVILQTQMYMEKYPLAK